MFKKRYNFVPGLRSWRTCLKMKKATMEKLRSENVKGPCKTIKMYNKLKRVFKRKAYGVQVTVRSARTFRQKRL